MKSFSNQKSDETPVSQGQRNAFQGRNGASIEPQDVEGVLVPKDMLNSIDGGPCESAPDLASAEYLPTRGRLRGCEVHSRSRD